jgi:hypothetical protein
MSMSHKAYAFDWLRFERNELSRVLWHALETSNPAALRSYITAHVDELKDPYEGEPLDLAWEEKLENRDVHEYGDYALTRFYDPAEDWGSIAAQWRAIDGRLSTDADRSALLGTPFGPPGNYFDPGRQGSYFQTPEEIAESLSRVRQFSTADLEEYQEESLKRFEQLLKQCAADHRGLYVTF